MQGDWTAIAFRPACEEDLPFLIRLRETTMRPHIEKGGTAYREQEQLSKILNRFEDAQIVVFEGQDVGLLKLDRREDPWFLFQFQIAPAFQGRGLGAWLLSRMLAEAQRAHVGVKLSVLKENPAKRLYEKVGFRLTGEDGAHNLMLCLPL